MNDSMLTKILVSRKFSNSVVFLKVMCRNSNPVIVSHHDILLTECTKSEDVEWLPIFYPTSIPSNLHKTSHEMD